MGKYTDILEGAVNVDIDLAIGGYDYFGFIRKNGEWIIMKSTESTAVSTRYKVGGSGYATAWTNRTSLTYGYPTIG